MNALSIIRQFKEVFLRSRRQGSTTALLTGIKPGQKAVCIVADIRESEYLRELNPDVEFVGVKNLAKLVGKRSPIIVDNHAIQTVLGMAESLIEERDGQLRVISKALKDAAAGIDTLLADQD